MTDVETIGITLILLGISVGYLYYWVSMYLAKLEIQVEKLERVRKEHPISYAVDGTLLKRIRSLETRFDAVRKYPYPRELRREKK
jgi:hypothetical protein